MTEEQNSYAAPESSAAIPPQHSAASESSSPEPGQGQGRRRRRRKRKGTRAAEQNGQPQNQQANGHNGGQQHNNGNQFNGQNGGQSQGKSKRFFRKQRQQNPGNSMQANPGNGNGNGNGQGRRSRNKQRRQPAAFVGPMDHSYRMANGNVADSPPSTIPLHNGNVYNGSRDRHFNDNVNGNVNNGGHHGYGHGHHNNVNGNINGNTWNEPVIAVRENAPTRIFCYIEDLFFLAKIQETARKLGIKVEFVKSDRDLITELSEKPEAERPGLILFDLNNANSKPLTTIPKLRSKLKRSTSIVGFLSHLQGDLKMRATEAGCDVVMPRSAFSQNLPNLLRRYGLEEEEENEMQPI